MKKITLFILMLITPIAVHATKFHFEENLNDVAPDGAYYSCSLEGNKAYCLYNKNVRSEQSVIQEIDLDTASVRVVKELGNSDIYSELIKIGDKYLAPGTSVVDRKISVYVLDSNFNVIKEFPIATGGYMDRYVVKKINGEYYLLNQAINIVSDGVALKVSADLETSTLVYPNEVTGDEFESIRVYEDLHNYFNSEGFSRYIECLVEYKGGYLVEHSSEDAIYDKFIFYKDGEIKWEKDYDGSFSPPFISGDNIVILNEITKPVTTYVSEYREDGSLVKEYPITNINEKGRLFLNNFYIGEYNDIYYWFTYKPNELEDFYTGWAEWRITTVTLVNTITNLSPNYLDVIDYAYPDDEVTLSINKDKEASIEKIIVRDANGKEITLNNNKFTMPDNDVTVEVIIKNPNTKNSNLIIITTLFIMSLTLIFYKIADKSRL